jgi:hypothetical protein
MLQRIAVQIVEMLAEIPLVADQMLPEAMQPESASLFRDTPLGQMAGSPPIRVHGA